MLSVVVPMLNEAGLVKERLAELSQCLSQAQLKFVKPQDIELIVVDGGSRDESVEQAKQVVDYIVQSAPGRGLQMNVGACHAKGETIIFLHLDTRLPDTLAQVVQQFQQSCHQWGFFPVRLDGNAFAFRVIERCISWRSTFTSIATGDQAFIVRRDFFHQIGGFSEMPLMEDLAFSQKCRQREKPWISEVPVVTSSRRWERKGTVRTVLLMWGLRAAYWLGCSPNTLARFYR